MLRGRTRGNHVGLAVVAQDDRCLEPDPLSDAPWRADPGTAGGQMAPRAIPQFGPVSRKGLEPPTPAQDREAG